MSREPAEYLGETVRVWDAQHSGVFVTGKVIAVCLEPSLIIEDEDGVRHTHIVSLPIDVQTWQPDNHRCPAKTVMAQFAGESAE